MKKEQIVDMIGEAPDEYVKDAKEHKKKRRIPATLKWISGTAAVLAIVISVNAILNRPLAISTKAVSIASESRKMERPKVGSSSDEYDIWWAERDARQLIVNEAQKPISDFAKLVSGALLTDSAGENRIWSPVNAYIALSMTAEMTGGETRSQLLDLLGARDTDELRGRISAVWEDIYENDGNEISVLANSLWLDEEVTYIQEKMDTLARDYYASVYQGDLGSEQVNRDITNWMHNNTGGLLGERKENPELDPDDQIFTIASTIYFQSKWGDEFNKANNRQRIFHSADGDMECTFMNREKYTMNYYWGEDFGAVQMPLKNGSSMWFILPDGDKTVDDVLSSDEYMEMLTHKYLYTDDADENLKYVKVNLSVPKFDVSSSINVKDGLMSVGITDIFDPSVSDFSPSIAPSDSFAMLPYVSAINQDTRVIIDEEGVSAASYIEIIGAGAGAPPDEIIDFILDRPFVFAITKNYIPLFVGTVNKP